MGLRKIALAGLAGLLIPAWYVAQQPASRTVVEGTVLDRTTGAPLADVTLYLTGIGRGSREGKTDSAGAFAFTSVEAGRYFLEATGPDYLPQGCCPANEEYGSDVREFTVTAGQTYQTTIQMLRSATISGRIFDNRRVPLANARVFPSVLRPPIWGPQILGTAEGATEAITNAEGEYRITRLRPGEYYLSAVPRASTPAGQASDNAALTYYPGFRNPDQAVPVRVNAGSDIHGINFGIEPSAGVRVSGRIVNPFTNETPNPLAYQFTLVPRDARILLQPGTAYSLFPDFDPAPDEFEIRNVPAGTYDLFVTYAPRPTDVRVPRYGGRAVLDVDDREVTNLAVTIDPPVEIKGQIILDDSARALVRDLRVLDVLLSRGEPMPVFLAPVDSPQVQADGTFLFSHVNRGRYVLALTGNSRVYVQSARLGGRDVLTEMMDIGPAPAGPLIVEVRGDGAIVEGVVTDREAKTVRNARVVVIPSRTFRLDRTAYKDTVTDEQGRYSLIGLRPDNYTIYAFTRLPDGWLNEQYMLQHAAFAMSVGAQRNQRIRQDLKIIPSP